MDVLLQSASTLRAYLQAGEMSARELLAHTLARIARLNPALHAVVATDVAAATAAARESDARFAAGTARPLEGLPVTIKDCFEVVGMPTAVGAPALKDYVPAADASAVARVRAAGAVILGKTNVPVFTGDFQTYNPLYGTTNDPWDVARSPGGSSGGSAVAVACGFSAFELGSDLGGSLRWPAHACGVFSLKTTWNLVSTYGTIPPPVQKRLLRNPDLLVAGPMARSAADLDLVLAVIAGPRDPTQPAAILAPPRKWRPEGLRVALWADDPFAPVDASVSAAVRFAARQLADAGAVVDEAARPAFSFAEAWEIFAVLNHAVVGFGLPDKVRTKIAAQGRGSRRGDLSHAALQSRGVRLAPGDYNDINARRQILRRKWARFFERYDVLLCPPASIGALAHDQSADMLGRSIVIDGAPKPYFDLMFWASLAAGGDLPAAIAPVMRAVDGLPRGVQIVANAFEDRTAVAVAGMVEALCGGFAVPPQARFD